MAAKVYGPQNETAIEWALRTRPTAALAFLRSYYSVRLAPEDRELKLAWDCISRAIGVEVDSAPVDAEVRA
jgi:hypothetical protein